MSTIFFYHTDLKYYSSVYFKHFSIKYKSKLIETSLGKYKFSLRVALDTILVFGAVMMTDSYTKKTDSKTRKIMTVGGLALVVFLFSVILSIFKSKAHGYPYR